MSAFLLRPFRSANLRDLRVNSFRSLRECFVFGSPLVPEQLSYDSAEKMELKMSALWPVLCFGLLFYSGRICFPLCGPEVSRPYSDGRATRPTEPGELLKGVQRVATFEYLLVENCLR